MIKIGFAPLDPWLRIKEMFTWYIIRINYIIVFREKKENNPSYAFLFQTSKIFINVFDNCAWFAFFLMNNFDPGLIITGKLKLED